MKNEEAKFILGAYRPDGRDAGDQMFAESLAQAERDPELRAWLEEQRRFDATLGAKLQQIAPPAGLKEAILAGARASASAVPKNAPRETRAARRQWWSSPSWLAAAAAIAIGVFIGGQLLTSAGRPAVEGLAMLAMRDLAEAHDNHVGRPMGLRDVQVKLATVALPLAGNLKLDLAELRKQNCRSVTLGGREMFEVCFQRDGAWFHVYVGRRDQFAPGVLDPKALMKLRGEYAATSWADGELVYTLVASGAESLRRVI